ncbi:pilus assembly PilX family protein [Marinobacter salarius]|jgi:type IV pilus assembly protein PilX|uniref:pilus assembly PilX family protein n=1 Tax=Marinobacter salarius TaxID=1420917 RepID=UPI003BAB43B9
MKDFNIKKGQKGAVLVISLVLLLVLTLMGVAGMNSSTMQERMAANAQNSNRAFQGAESSVWALLEQLYDNDLSLLRDSMKSADEKSDVVSYTLDSAKGISGTHQARYLGEVIITSGSSMDANESSPTLKGYRYELKGTATMAGSGAGATIYKGIEYY